MRITCIVWQLARVINAVTKRKRSFTGLLLVPENNSETLQGYNPKPFGVVVEYFNAFFHHHHHYHSHYYYFFFLLLFFFIIFFFIFFLISLPSSSISFILLFFIVCVCVCAPKREMGGGGDGQGGCVGINGYCFDKHTNNYFLDRIKLP